MYRSPSIFAVLTISTARGLFSQMFLGQRLKEANFSLAPMTGYGFFSPVFLFSSLCSHLLPIPQASDKGLIEWQWPGTAAEPQCSPGPPAARDKCSHPRGCGLLTAMVWSGLGAGFPHWMGTQRKAAKSMKGSSGSEGNLLLEGQLQIFPSSRQSWGQAVLGRALCWALGAQAQGFWQIFLNVSLGYDSDDAVRPFPFSHTTLPPDLSNFTVPVHPSCRLAEWIPSLRWPKWSLEGW